MSAMEPGRGSIFGDEGGCSFHGDEDLKECRICGQEFCSACSPGTRKCQECLDAELEGDDIEERPPADENYDDLVDEEADARVEEAENFSDSMLGSFDDDD